MNTSDKEQKSSGTSQSITTCSADQTSVQSPTVHITEVEAELELRTELNRARGYYRLGRYSDAEAELEKLVKSMERMMTKGLKARGHRLGQLSLLYASSLSVLGRTRQRLDKRVQGESDLRRAVDIFNQSLEAAGKLTGDDYNEYGLALYLVGDREKAVEMLERSIENGNLCSEAYTYLALSLRDQQYSKAEALLRKA